MAPNSKTTTMKKSMTKQTISPSYHGMISFRYMGFCSRRMDIPIMQEQGKSRQMAAVGMDTKPHPSGVFRRGFRLFSILGLLIFLGGCAVASKRFLIEDTGQYFSPGTIIDTGSGQPVTYDALVRDLSAADVVFIGERHTRRDHHGIQLRLIKSLHEAYPEMAIGVEMIDRTYQPVLDLWTAGELEETAFLEAVHWYANWKFDFSLYRDIFDFARENRIRLMGLNLPFHIPPKIAVGGMKNLSPGDRKHLAAEIDLTDERHRDYIQKIFRHHRSLRGRDNFEHFYTAQCAWEDTMAESIARQFNGTKMVVLAGNGHIIQRFGIPERTFRRIRKPYKTVLPVTAGDRMGQNAGDYLWVTPDNLPRP